MNTAIGEDSVVIGRVDVPNHPTNVTVIGAASNVVTQAAYSVAIGYNAKTNTSSSVAIGATTSAANKAVAIGFYANATKSIQISCGTSSSTTNNDANTVKLANENGNFEIMSADGTIPADRTSPITTISSATVTQALANNYIYNCTVDMTSIEITLPATPTANFCAQLNFTSGSTPTAFTSPAGMVWLGDDVSTTFVPVANKRYAIMVFFDGVSTRGIVQAA